MSRGQRIAVRRETVVAFLGPAPRGPVSIPVTVRNIDEYLKRFGAPDYSDPLLNLLTQFFRNGGTRAIVVRVSQTSRRSQVSVPGPSGSLILDAVNPGPQECLRASVDYDHIPDEEDTRFNLVIHRMTSRQVPIVEEQEIFHNVSASPDDSNFIIDALLDSSLVRSHGSPPSERPDSTLHLGVDAADAYIYSTLEWRHSEILTDYDLIGSRTEGTGIFSLDMLPIVDIVCMASGGEPGDIGPVALFAAERYCRKRNALLLLDPPPSWTSVDAVREACREREFSSPNVVIYFPRPVGTGDRGGASFSSAIGAIAGGLSAPDSIDGTLGSPDGTTLSIRGHFNLAADLSDEECRILARAGINSLQRVKPGNFRFSNFVTFTGGRFLAADWRALRKRRSALFIVDGIARGTRWAAFEENNQETWTEICNQTARFLKELCDEGTLTGLTAADACYVICDSETNHAGLRGEEARAGFESRAITFFVGFTLYDREPLAFRFVQDVFDCTVRDLGWRPGIALAG